MIVVFVVDNSPSMGLPASGDSGMSRLDTAKMCVEDIVTQMRKRQTQHVKLITEETSTENQRSYVNLGLGGSHPDQFLLLSTAPQYPEASGCAAGGRLLVGFGTNLSSLDSNNVQHQMDTQGDATLDDHHMKEAFNRQLKSLKAASWDSSSGKPFPDEAGGAKGLNAALSASLQLISRYRLQSRYTENFGLGRLPNQAIAAAPVTQSPVTGALQPACLIVLTDGSCLRQSPKMGGGQLQLQYGSQPLREFYTEPFRWDHRILCLGVGGKDGISSTQYLHPQLRALCEVTGGSHWVIRNALVSNLSRVTESVLKRVSPPLPREVPLSDPLTRRSHPSMTPNIGSTPMKTIPGLTFVHGGPVVALQAYEADEVDGQQRPPKTHRCCLLYVGSQSSSVNVNTNASQDPKYVVSPPVWCIPEAHFPSKKLDTLPPRKAQPHLFFSKYPANLGSKSFEAVQVMKMLQRLDHVTTSNRKHVITPQVKCLQRDVYICEWLSPEGGKPVKVSVHGQQEYFPVFVSGAGRPSLSGEESDNFLNIGILHIPVNGSSTLAASANAGRLATLTILPPDPHILLPLLIRAAEAEHRVLKKLEVKGTLGKGTTASATAKTNVPVDENWRNEVRAYLFRLPAYYQGALRRALRPILPTSANNLFAFDASPDAIMLQCFSKVCLQKIRNGEQIAKDNNERLERQEIGLRSKYWTMSMPSRSTVEEKVASLRYGAFDKRGELGSYLAALRNMPAPWRASKHHGKGDMRYHEPRSSGSPREMNQSSMSVMESLGDLPRDGLMAFYESRRRWIFGGTGLTIRGLHVEGVNYDGSNSQRCNRTPAEQPECPLTRARVGVSSVNQSSTSKMGDYRERLLYSKPPIVGYGSNDFAGVSATTAVDGSPRWSVDDDAMPMAFFNPETGEFEDSVQARLRSRLMVNFGNPYKEKRADSLIPTIFLRQAPSKERGISDSLSSSPPHDSFDSVEEGEAVFVMKSPSRTSPLRHDETTTSSSDLSDLRPAKKAKTENPKPPAPKPPSTQVPTDASNPTDKISAKVDAKQAPARPPLKPQGRAPPPKPKGALKRPSFSSHPAPPKPPPVKPEMSKLPPPKPPTEVSKPPAPKPPSTQVATDASIPTDKISAKVGRAPPPKPKGALERPSFSSHPAPPKPPPIKPEMSKLPPPKPPTEASKPPAPKPPSTQVATDASNPTDKISAKVDVKQAPARPLSKPQGWPAPSKPSVSKAPSKPAGPSNSEFSRDAPMSAGSKNALPAVPATPSVDLQRPDVKPEVDLPTGWICVWSKSQKRWYFFNTKNNQSVWQWPPP